MSANNRMPTYFISHGGGPWPWLEGSYREALRPLEKSLQQLPSELPAKPKSILMISGHWEESQFTVMTNLHPPMVYDYGGFPEHTYRIQYPAPGSAELASRVSELLGNSSIAFGVDSERGFDHGTFAPLAVSYPKADVPVVQLSLRADYDPEAHIELGRALTPLRDEGVLIIASGLSYHNLRLFDQRAAKPSHEFDAWLQTTMSASSAERTSRLLDWQAAPSARLAHPSPDHLIPLMVAVGAAENEQSRLSYHEDQFLGGIAVSSFRIG